MNPPHSTGLRTQTCLDPMKEAAWGARPRTVRAAALLGVRLYDRRPAPICVGGVYRPRLELGGPLSRCPAPGLECRPPSPRPTVSSPGLQAGCARVEGGGWVVGWGFEPHSRATLGFLSGCGPRAAAAVSRSGLEGAAAG